MTFETFSWIWSTIEPSIESIESEIEEEERKRLRFHKVYDNEQAKKVIFQEYDRIRRILKTDYYKNHAPAEGETNLIDHHKIAACLCQAFLQKKIYAFDINDTITAEMLLSNYKLAYTASLVVIYLCMLDWYIYKKDVLIVNKLLEQKQLMAPETTTTHAPYHEGRIKTLAQNEHRGISFDVLTYASVMYWLEYYNRQLLEDKVVLEAYDPEAMGNKGYSLKD